jgi:uncharacterized DUF497 family protein/predicted DNA binding CopG/RHH family protein
MGAARFDWDRDKDLVNQEKHGVSFAEAQYAFADPRRVIAEDLSHSEREKRYYCFGQVVAKFSPCVLLTAMVLSASSAPVTGGKERQFMRAKIKYTDETLGDLRVIQDFLPSPDELAFREEEVKITIALSKRSIEFFRTEAEKHDTQYQPMIRRLLDAYVEAHSKPLARHPPGVRVQSRPPARSRSR